MNLTLNRKDLLLALAQVKAAASGRTSMPILNHVRIKSVGQELEVVGNSLTLSSIAKIFLPFGSEEIDLCFPFQHFSSLLAGFQSEEIVLLEVKEEVFVKADKAKYKVHTMKGEEFPRLPVVEGFSFTIDALTLRGALQETLTAVSTDENRAILTGVLMVVQTGGGAVKFVATDTHRLVVTSRDAEEDPAQEAKSVVMPGDFCKELVRLLSKSGDVKVTVGNAFVSVEYDNVTVTSKVVEGQFPNYSRVIPTVLDKVVWLLSKSEMIPAIKRALTVAKENSNRIVFTQNSEGLTARADSKVTGSGVEELSLLSGSTDTETEYQTAFNGQYFLDALNGLQEDVFQICMTEPLRPGVILVPETNNEEGVVKNNYLCVLMPMQVV